VVPHFLQLATEKGQEMKKVAWLQDRDGHHQLVHYIGFRRAFKEAMLALRARNASLVTEWMIEKSGLDTHKLYSGNYIAVIIWR